MIPINRTAQTVRTMLEWRKLAPRYHKRTAIGAARAYAAEHGKAIIMLATDAAFVYERAESGKVLEHYFEPGSIHWHSGDYRP